jgi:hypothetical protein
MRREALYEKASWFKGRWTDLAVHAVRVDEWQPPVPTLLGSGHTPPPEDS